MEELISVIIPDEINCKYLVRCLNSICRQTYKNFEILFIGNELSEELIQRYEIKLIGGKGNQNTGERFNTAIWQARGRYLLFCSMTSVLASNVLEELIKHAGNTEACVRANYMLLDGENYESCEKAEISIYGKLFDKQTIDTNKIYFADGNIYMRERFVLTYLHFYQRSCVDEKIYIYETNKKIFDENQREGMDEKELCDIIQLVKNSVLEKKYVLLCDLLEQIYFESDNEDCLVELVMKTAELLNTEKELHYMLAGKYVKEWYLQALKGKNEFYEAVKRYLGYFKHNKFFCKVILNVCGIEEELYQMMEENELEEYLFYVDKLSYNENYLKCVEEIASLKKEIEAERERINGLEYMGENRRKGNSIVNVGITDREYLSEPLLAGPELADFVIEKYGEGALGMKTIIHSIRAWLKYKF
mgnify:CR=1 FL=1